MKKCILSLMGAMLGNIALAANCVTVKQIGTDYASHQITLALTRTGCTGDATNHRNTVWVFVDYRETGGSSWTRATISAASSGTVVNSGSSKGAWIYGANGTQTVTLTLGGMPAKYDWCAFATDYPPNVATFNNGTYTFRGTAPFLLNGSISVNSNTYAGTVISSITDATGCPGIACGSRDANVGAGGCCLSGLTLVGGYCRDLVADAASTYIGCGFEIKAADISCTYANRNQCPSGWHVPTFTELKCMWNARVSLNLTTSYVYWSSSTTGYEHTCTSNVNTASYYLSTHDSSASSCGYANYPKAGGTVRCQACYMTTTQQRVRCVR